MTLTDLKGKRIGVLGRGANHEHLLKVLEKHGINFEVIDGWNQIGDLNLLGFDIVFRTPGVPYLSAPIQEALRHGVTIYSQTRLFFDLCPAKIISITGTKGKGTTANLIAKILEAGGLKAYLAGNIGNDPFEFLDQLTARDWVVLELSSFQLQDLQKSPHIAVILKITPEHLDHHASFDEYVEAKRAIVKFQSERDFAVIYYDSEISRSFATLTPGKVFWNSTVQSVRPGCWIEDEKIMLTHPAREDRGGGDPLMSVSEIQLLGRFNLENVTAAVAAAAAAGVQDAKVIRKAVSEFRGLPHRLEFVAEIAAVKYYNDSFSTTPETAIAALSAFSAPVILIAGGSDKNADYLDLGRTIAERQVKALLAIGITGPKIVAAVRSAGFLGKIYDVDLSDMEKIVVKAAALASSGDIVLLSPASASFDMFVNYKERGEQFNRIVKKYAKNGGFAVHGILSR